ARCDRCSPLARSRGQRGARGNVARARGWTGRTLASRTPRRWGLARPARLRNSRALSPSIDLVFAGRTTTALDEKLELCRLLYREFTRLSALQYLINVNCRTATDRQTVYAIRQKRAWH